MNKSRRKTFHARWVRYEWENDIGERVAVLTRLACDRALSLLALRTFISQENRNVFQSSKGIFNAVKDVIKEISFPSFSMGNAQRRCGQNAAEFSTLCKETTLTEVFEKYYDVIARYNVIKKCVFTYSYCISRGIFSKVKTVSCSNDPVRGENGASTPHRALKGLKAH